MSGKNDITVSDKALVAKVRDFSVKQAKSFKVETRDLNFEQYAKTIRAYALAGMPFEHIANAGDFLGDEVERKEVNAPFQNKNQSKIGEVAEDKSQILAWQARGERAALVHQIDSPAGTGTEIVLVSRDIAKSDNEQTVEVLEGIKVVKQTGVLADESQEKKLKENPFLRSPSLFKR